MVIVTDRDQISGIPDTQLRQLIELRIQGIEKCCDWDARELGPIIIVEPGDSASDLDTAMGFSILEGALDDSRFGDECFTPSFEFAECHYGYLYELVYIVSNSGYGYDIFIPSCPGVDPLLLTFCQTYAVPAS